MVLEEFNKSTLFLHHSVKFEMSSSHSEHTTAPMRRSGLRLFLLSSRKPASATRCEETISWRSVGVHKPQQLHFLCFCVTLINWVQRSWQRWPAAARHSNNNHRSSCRRKKLQTTTRSRGKGLFATGLRPNFGTSLADIPLSFSGPIS